MGAGHHLLSSQLIKPAVVKQSPGTQGNGRKLHTSLLFVMKFPHIPERDGVGCVSEVLAAMRSTQPGALAKLMGPAIRCTSLPACVVVLPPLLNCFVVFDVPLTETKALLAFLMTIAVCQLCR